MNTYDAIALPGIMESHFRANGAVPVTDFTHRGLRVYIAAGGPHFDTRGVVKLSDMDKWMHDGYYVATWAVQKDRQIIGQPLYFKLDHDILLTDEQREQIRVNAAIDEAKRFIDTGHEGGLYGQRH